MESCINRTSRCAQGKLESCGGSISEGIGQGRVTGNMEGFTPDVCFEIGEPCLDLVFIQRFIVIRGVMV